LSDIVQSKDQIYQTLSLEKPKTFSTIASSSPKLTTETMTTYYLSLPPPTNATQTTLPNVMVLTQSASSQKNPFLNQNNQPKFDEKNHNIPSSLNLIGTIVGIFLAVLFLNKIFKTLREIYESISKIAESICATNESQQDEEGYYNRNASEKVPRVFVQLTLTTHAILRTIHAIQWLRRRTQTILQAKISAALWFLFQPLCLQPARSFPHGLRAYPAKMLITSHIILHDAWYNWVTQGDHRPHLSVDILGSLKHALLDLESLTRISPFLPQSRRPPDPLQHDPTIHQRVAHAIRTANYIALSTASFLCTIMLRTTTQLAITLTRPLRAPANHLTLSLARNLASRLTSALENSDNTPKKDFDMDKLTRATHELQLINPEERSATENTKLLAQLTALVSSESTNKGKAIFDPGGKSVCIDTGASGTIWTWRQ
jgi:hypothetical protein